MHAVKFENSFQSQKAHIEAIRHDESFLADGEGNGDMAVGFVYFYDFAVAEFSVNNGCAERDI